MRPGSTAVFLLLYPFVAHFSVITGYSFLAFAYLIMLGVVLVIKRMILPFKVILVVSTLPLVWWLSTYKEIERPVLFSIPVLINLALFITFSGALFRKKTPLITRFAQLTRGELTEKERRYTGLVTVLWSVIFILLAVESAGLAVFATYETWSLFTNVLNYVFVAAIFILEFAIRSSVLESWKNEKFLNFIKIMIKTDLKKL